MRKQRQTSVRGQRRSLQLTQYLHTYKHQAKENSPAPGSLSDSTGTLTPAPAAMLSLRQLWHGYTKFLPALFPSSLSPPQYLLSLSLSSLLPRFVQVKATVRDALYRVVLFYCNCNRKCRSYILTRSTYLGGFSVGNSRVFQIKKLDEKRFCKGKPTHVSPRPTQLVWAKYGNLN